MAQQPYSSGISQLLLQQQQQHHSHHHHHQQQQQQQRRRRRLVITASGPAGGVGGHGGGGRGEPVRWGHVCVPACMSMQRPRTPALRPPANTSCARMRAL
jgi:hypothetical protein